MSENETEKFPFWSALGIWFLLSLIAIVNGAIRNFLITPYVGEYAGHFISTITFIIFMFVVVWVYLVKTKINSENILFKIGALWIGITIIFEFIFGYLVMGHTMEKLLNDYNIIKGRVWILVLFATFFSPIIVGKMLNRSKKEF